jgi:AraC-like DNA-binding protein
MTVAEPLIYPAVCGRATIDSGLPLLVSTTVGAGWSDTGVLLDTRSGRSGAHFPSWRASGLRVLTPPDIFLTLDDMTLIRGSALLGYVELVEELGADPETLLRSAGVRHTAVGDHDAFIAYRSVIAALEYAASATGAADFGRRLALRHDLDILGPLAAAAHTASTTAEAFHTIRRHLALYSPAIAADLRLVDGEPLARFEFRIVLDRLPPHRQMIEMALGSALRMSRMVAGPAFTPVSAHLPHAALAPAPEYARYFGCQVKFEEPFSGFLLRREDMAKPLPSNAAVRQVVEAYLRSITPLPDGTVTGPVRALVRRLLPTGGLTLDLVAAHLAMHSRTLERHLAAEGTAFADLVDGARRDEAERCLRDTDMPLGQVAVQLGFSEQSVLSRACRRWYGESPSGYRRKLRARY